VLSAADDGGRLRDHAVLMRAAAHSDLLELELAARKIPYVKYGGLKFLEAAHVKDFLAAARVLLNPRDEIALFRLLRLHAGVGPARARKMLDVLIADPNDVNTATAIAPPAARLNLSATFDALAEGRRHSDASTQAAACLRASRPLVQARYRDAPARLADLDRLTETAAASADLAAFTADLTLEPPASTSDYAKPPHLDEDYLTLSTVHSAKGLEWPTVHLLHAVDGAFPSDMALSTRDGLDEERRVFYVAVTRARDHLHVYTPLRMPHHRHASDDRHSFAPQSRFLTNEAMAVMDVVHRPPPRPADAPAPAHARVAMPVLESLFE
jgi:DNA helicase-2/ATP-dependent DNA helicase PcrA